MQPPNRPLGQPTTKLMTNPPIRLRLRTNLSPMRFHNKMPVKAKKNRISSRKTRLLIQASRFRLKELKIRRWCKTIYNSMPSWDSHLPCLVNLASITCLAWWCRRPISDSSTWVVLAQRDKWYPQHNYQNSTQCKQMRCWYKYLSTSECSMNCCNWSNCKTHRRERASVSMRRSQMSSQLVWRFRPCPSIQPSTKNPNLW